MESKSLISQIGTIGLTIAGIILILYLAYITTKLLGNRFSYKGSGKKLKILDNMPIGKDKQIMIVKAGSKTFLIGSANESINLISELDSDEYPEIESNQEPIDMNFKTAFKKVLEESIGNKKEKVKKNDSDKTEQG